MSGQDFTAFLSLKQEGPGLEYVMKTSRNGHGKPVLKPAVGKDSSPLSRFASEMVK